MGTTTSRWASGTQCVVAVTLNLDAESVDLHEVAREDLYGRFSYGRYGMRAGVWRLLDLFKARRLNATVFVPALDAENHPEAIEAALAGGHEIAARGYRFEDHSALGERERDTLAEAHRLLARRCGAAPVGWRAPGGTLSSATLSHLVDLGYEYDASFQDDDFPYRMARSDGRTLVEVPHYPFLDDSTLYSQRHTHERLLKTWREEFDALYDEGALVTLTLHARGEIGSGRASRVRVVDAFLEHASRRPGVTFMTCRELARWWAEHHPDTEPLPA